MILKMKLNGIWQKPDDILYFQHYIYYMEFDIGLG